MEDVTQDNSVAVETSVAVEAPQETTPALETETTQAVTKPQSWKEAAMEAVKKANVESRSEEVSQDKASEVPVTKEVKEDSTNKVPLPSSWSPKMEETFRAMPPEIQKQVYDRETARDRFVNEKSMELSPLKEYDNVVREYSDKLQLDLNGVRPVDVVRQLLATQHAMNQNPAMILDRLAATYGLEPRYDDMYDAPQVDPQVSTLERELQQLKSQVQTQQEFAKKSDLAKLEKEFEDHANGKLSSGEARMPYYREVYNDMLPILQTVYAQMPHLDMFGVLEEAYDRACYMNPKVREKVLSNQLKQREVKHVEEQQVHLERARNAASSISGTSMAQATPKAPGSWKEAARMALKQSKIKGSL